MDNRWGVVLVAFGLCAGAAGCEDETSSSPGPNPDITLPDGGGGGLSDAGDAGGPTDECVPPTGGPTMHTNNVSADETWTATASPHVVPNDITIDANVTVEPCAEILVGASVQLSIGASGSLVANGTPTKRIPIGASEPGKPFARIRAGGGRLELAHVTVDGGGDPQNATPYLAGMIEMRGTDNSAPTQELLKVDSVVVEGSASNGVLLQDGAGFAAGSTKLTVKGSKLHPVSIWSRAVGTLPDGTYTGNADDSILLPAIAGNESVRESTTMRDRGVPYLVGHPTSAGTLYVAGSPTAIATLTIEPGVVVRFKKDGLLFVEPSAGVNPATGALVAKGTAEKPIVFTSAEATPAAGDWRGIWFGQIPSATNAIDHARVEYAGGQSTSGSDSCVLPGGPVENDAAIRVLGAPASVFVTNTTILASASHGIDRGYRSATKHDFLASNTFTNVARCHQTYPKDSNGACPDPVPCPQ